jgi:hypothetical protein
MSVRSTIARKWIVHVYDSNGVKEGGWRWSMIVALPHNYTEASMCPPFYSFFLNYF